MLVRLSLLGLVELSSLTFNLWMRTDGVAPWGMAERQASGRLRLELTNGPFFVA